MITPPYNSSMALLGGWPFSVVAGDGQLGNRATAEVDAVAPSSTPASPTGSTAAQAASKLATAQKNAPAGPSGRLV